MGMQWHQVTGQGRILTRQRFSATLRCKPLHLRIGDESAPTVPNRPDFVLVRHPDEMPDTQLEECGGLVERPGCARWMGLIRNGSDEWRHSSTSVVVATRCSAACHVILDSINISVNCWCFATSIVRQNAPGGVRTGRTFLTPG